MSAKATRRGSDSLPSIGSRSRTYRSEMSSGSFAYYLFSLVSVWKIKIELTNSLGWKVSSSCMSAYFLIAKAETHTLDQDLEHRVSRCPLGENIHRMTYFAYSDCC
jgi:hypothetical protein